MKHATQAAKYDSQAVTVSEGRPSQASLICEGSRLWLPHLARAQLDTSSQGPMAGTLSTPPSE